MTPRPEVVRQLLIKLPTEVPEATWPEIGVARKLRAHDFTPDQLDDDCVVVLVDEFLAMLAENLREVPPEVTRAALRGLREEEQVHVPDVLKQPLANSLMRRRNAGSGQTAASD